MKILSDISFKWSDNKAGLLFLVLSVMYLLNAPGLKGQLSIVVTDSIYGSDPVLFNGKFYTFFTPSNTGGSQFFYDSQFETGSAIIRGKTYKDLLLNYDIYNQQLILKYINRSGAATLLVLSDAWIEGFSMRDKNFEFISIDDTLKRIYQVIGEDHIRIFYYWQKKLSLDNFHGATNHVFSESFKEMNLFIDDRIIKYWNNKSFCLLFGAEKSRAIREYLRRYRINVRKSSDKTINQLITYCNTLYMQ